jgi:hypothetical protein
MAQKRGQVADAENNFLRRFCPRSNLVPHQRSIARRAAVATSDELISLVATAARAGHEIRFNLDKRFHSATTSSRLAA